MESDFISKVLCREIGRLVGPISGLGARWAARKLPNVGCEKKLNIAKETDVVLSTLRQVLSAMGKEVPEFPNDGTSSLVTVLVGSGRQNLNPTLVQVRAQSNKAGTELHLYAVAKEGAIKQNSAALAIARVREALVEKSA